MEAATRAAEAKRRRHKCKGAPVGLDDADTIAARVLVRRVYGEEYRGRLDSESSYASITTRDLRKLHKAAVRPDRAVILAGGDLKLDKLVPALEAALTNADEWGVKTSEAQHLYATAALLVRLRRALLADNWGGSSAALMAVRAAVRLAVNLNAG